KQGAGDWVQQESGPPDLTQFTYRAPKDGEYWFSVVTITRDGRAEPADVRNEPPGLQVVVDTQEPLIEVTPATGAEGEVLLRCTLQDANPDYQTMELIYRGADQVDRTLKPLPGQQGTFRIPRETWNRPVLIKASDR